MEQWDDGEYVKFDDYDALAAKLAEAEALIDKIEADCREGLHDCSRLTSNPPQNPAAYHVLHVLIAPYRRKFK
jgi:hypothetical protein